MARLTAGQFWTQVEAASRLAEVKGARFPDDTPEKRLRRKARSVVSGKYFNETYLPHYFRDEGSPFHDILGLALEWERRMSTRAPRGHAKSTLASFAYPLRQVVCGLVLRAWEDGTLAETDPELAAAIKEEMAAEVERRIAAGPLSCAKLGIPEHWDPDVTVDLDRWLATVHARLVAERRIPLHWDPYIQIIAVDTDTAVEFTAAIRLELDLNELIRSDWGDLTCCKSGDWRRRKRRAASDGDFESNACRVKAYGMQQSIRGGKHGAWRPSLVIFDDPDSEETTRTLKQRDRAERKITRAVKYGLEPKKSRVLMVGTPVHADCLVCRFTEKDVFKKRWVGLRFRAADESDVVLYPAKWTIEMLAEERLEDEEGYGSELDDRPPSDGEQPFHTLHHYDRAEYEHMPLTKVLAFDPSYGRSNKSDFQALVVLRGPTPAGEFLVHRCELWRIPDPELLVDSANEVYAEEEPDAAVIEMIALGILLEFMLVSRGSRIGLFPSWIRITRHDDGKDLRIRGQAHMVNTGKLRFPSDGSCRQLENQYRSYPHGKKDGPDGVEMALRQLRNRKRRGGAGAIRHLPGRGAEFGKGGW